MTRPTTRPRVVVDARPLSHPQAGGFRAYVRALTRGLTEWGEARGAARPLDLLLYFDRPPAPEVAAGLPPWAETRVLHPDRLKADLRLFPAQVRRDAPDLVHGTVNYAPNVAPCPTVVTIHDAMGVKRYPWSARVTRSPRERLMNAYWAVQTRRSARSARRIVTVSKGAGAEVADALGVPPERIHAVYNGLTLPAPSRRSGSAGEPRRDDVLLAIASPDRRKNLETLYQALGGAHRAAFGGVPPPLEVVGTSPRAAAHTEERLRANGVENYRLLKAPDDQTLADAYARAAIFVWPSFMEGFGLPPLEAMLSGCPVVSSSAPVMPEILGDVPAYFDPERPDELAARLAAWLKDPAERAARGARGETHAARFTCLRMAEETVAVWQAALSRGEGRRP